ncbi:MAG TPA: hypothetical protein VFM02_04630 [Candidatus Paceibacterota bacterium]|nr:hypothetical protein [Candidatus Paceibacterota bacterium]
MLTPDAGPKNETKTYCSMKKTVSELRRSGELIRVSTDGVHDTSWQNGEREGDEKQAGECCQKFTSVG